MIINIIIIIINYIHGLIIILVMYKI